MSAATVQLGILGRGVTLGDIAAIELTVTGVSTSYSAAGGGLPFDLVTALQAASPSGWFTPNYIQTFNPADIVGIVPLGLSASGYFPTGLTVGTPTYTAVPWQSANGETATPGILETCPATLRLIGIGASSSDNASFGQTDDAANSDSATFLLIVMRSGANN